MGVGGELRGQVACGNLWVTYVTKKGETHGGNRSNYQLHVLTPQETLYLTFFLLASDLQGSGLLGYKELLSLKKRLTEI